MIHLIAFEDTAAAKPEEREFVAMSASQSLIRRGRRYLLRFSAPLEHEFEISPREAFRFCEWCGGLEPFDVFTREDLVKEAFPYHWRKFLAETEEGAR